MSGNVTQKRHLPKWMETLYQQKNVPESSNTDVIKSKTLFCTDDDINAGNIKSAVLSSHQSSSKHPVDIVSLSMPLLRFCGSLVYTAYLSDCACLCQDIVSGLSLCEKAVIGFDMEWPVTYQKNSEDKTALIQMCLSDKTCYLFHVGTMSSFPKPLENLILDQRVILVGLNIASDLWKLARDFDVRVKISLDRGSVVDVGTLARQILKTSERWDLDGLCRNVLGHCLDKDHKIRCGNWSDVPLSEEQKLYAANDALASLLIYKKLQEIELKQY
ncbi:Werner syndrome ATP-dependent helicase [Biomphalaria pfeifferi]|uniref:3'-5' exonuclease n=1 Tax=Biomphalaria pfeifferi TaxID=112525 RepID=A0AAD8BM54_BIOPF|nr:Werner syndrome ATP-dependent helicase [Biomphalaria pfeifferi]